MIRQKIQRVWDENPLGLILGLAILFRLIAVIFSKGYGMLDDHFLVIEAAQSWVDGYDYNRWLPGSGNTSPQGHSFFYVGIHYILLILLEKIHLTDPQAKMYVIRLIHAAFSLLIVSYGYKITEKLADKHSARQVGLLLALLWFMPFMSVRNMVEVVCMPFLLWGTFLLIEERKTKTEKVDLLRKTWLKYFWVGILFGIAFSIRYQTLIFTGGVGLVLLFNRKFIETFVLGAAYLLAIFLTQGIIDMFIWGYPFAELIAYIQHNITYRTDYIIAPWYNYILLILGILIPPVSFFLFFGFFRTGLLKKYLIIFLPTLLFLVFHSYYPNKQERFILPVLPFFIILGIIGWNSFISISGFWKKRKKLLTGCWIFFWALNLTLLPVITTTYSKRAKVESMTYLSRYDDIRFILFENSNKYGQMLLPRYYLDEWIRYTEITRDNYKEPIGENLMNDPNIIPRFFVFVEEENLDERIQNIESYFPDMIFETKIEPGFMDKLLHWLNPVNANEAITIYRNAAMIPEKKHE